MPQKELAEKVGVTRQTIIAIEKGNYSPSLELALKIAKKYLNLYWNGPKDTTTEELKT